MQKEGRYRECGGEEDGQDAGPIEEAGGPDGTEKQAGAQAENSEGAWRQGGEARARELDEVLAKVAGKIHRATAGRGEGAEEGQIEGGSAGPARECIKKEGGAERVKGVK